MAEHADNSRRRGIPPKFLSHGAAAALAALFLLAGSAQAQTATATVPVGTGAQSIAVNPVTNKMYVANFGSASVTVIDGATNTTTTVAVGSHPGAVAVNTVTNRVYVTNSGGGSVTIIDGATDTVITTVAAGINPTSVAVNPVTNKIYVTAGSAELTVIDGVTNTATSVVLGARPFAVAVNPVTNKIYVTFGTSPGGVSVIDGASNTVVKVLFPFSTPAPVVVNPVTNRVYIATIGSSEVTVIDGATDTAITTLSVPGSPFAMAVNPVTNRVYVANSGGSVTVINGVTNTTTTVPVGSFPRNVAVNPTTNMVYVANSSGGNVTVIDGATNLTTTLGAGSSPLAVGVNPVTNKVYVANAGSNDVTVIDGASYPTATVAVGLSPFHAAVNPVTNKIYVANQSNNTVSVIDGATNARLDVQVGTRPNFVAVNPLTNKVYVTNEFSSNLTVIDGATNTTTTVATGFKPSCVAVNPVTNKIYVTTQDDIAVLDGVTNVLTPIVATGVSTQSVAVNIIAVNPVTNRIYVAHNNASNTVTVIDGLTNSTTTVPTGSLPLSVAVNPVTNKIYVNNFSSDDVTVIDGATNSTTTVPLPSGSLSRSLAVNPLTNLIYVVNGNNTVTVIDGATHSTATLAAGSVAVAVNQVTNKIYAVNIGGHVTVIDGLTNATTTVPTGFLSRGVAINPLTNKAYVVNSGDASVTVISGQNVQAIPLTTTISPLPNDETSSATPSFTFTANSTFSPTAPAVAAVYFQFDTWQGPWAAATPTGPGAFSGTAPTLSPGIHILYAYAADGQDATSIQGRGQSSPMIGQIAAYLFLVAPVSAPPPPPYSIGDISVTKPASGTADAIFTVTLNAVNTQTVTVDFATADHTAFQGIDFQATSGTLSFAPGETSKQIVVPILGGAPNGSDKSFFVVLSDATHASISAEGTILAGNAIADLAISASGAPDPIATGNILTYVVNVTNKGPSTATGVTMTYVMPAGAVFDSVSTSGTVGCNVPAVGSSGTVTCNFGILAATGGKGVSIMVKPQTAGTLSSLFSVAAKEPDSDTTNNSITATTTVNLASVVINITENIIVTDTPFVLPSAMIGVAENIVVTDAPGVLPSAMIGVTENITVIDAPSLQPSAMIGVTENIIVTDTPQVFDTAQGTNVVVTPVDPATNTAPVTLTFNSVLQPGSTTLTSSSSGPPTPAGFALGSPPVYYDLSTTAQFKGNVTVCISYAKISFKGSPSLFHFENGVWVDVTVSVDTTNQIVCGAVTSLSPFALFEPNATFSINLLYDPSKAKKSGSTFPIKIQITDAAGNNRSSAQIVVTAVGIVRVSDDSPAPLEDSGEANPDFNFRFDAALGGTGGYIFNLSTKGFASGTYRLVFTISGDSVEHFVPFQVK